MIHPQKLFRIRPKASAFIAIAMLFLLSAGGKLFGQVNIADPEYDKVLAIIEDVKNNNNFLEELSPESNVALPFGIIKKIGNTRYIIAIDSVWFLPNGAYFNAYAAIDFPGNPDKKLAFAGKNILFNPKGVVGGNQARLALVSTHNIPLGDYLTLNLPGDGSNFVEWDCSGFKAINLHGNFEFDKAKLIPDSTQTTDEKVKADFQIYTNDINNFVVQTSITPFIVPGLKNWSFAVTNATVDMSEIVNAPQMVFPVGYNNPNIVSPEMWTGFYLQSVEVTLPKEISKSGRVTKVTANNLLIDNMGLSGKFAVTNVFTTSEGSMSGWGFSIDNLGVEFVCNNLAGGQIGGTIVLPISDSSQALGYSASIFYNPQTQESDYQFVINPANNIDFNVFAAKVNLNNTSRLTIAKVNGKLVPTAVLDGNIAFHNNKMETNNGWLAFQSLTLTTQAPYLTEGVFSFNTSGGNQPKMAKFPVSITDITMGLNQGQTILGFGVAFNLKDDALAVTTHVKLKGQIVESQVSYSYDYPVTETRTRWTYSGASIDAITISIHTQPFTLDGMVAFRDNDPVYGNGFFGSIEFTIKKIMETPASVTACFGAVDAYRYYFVDVVVPVNIQFGASPISINKIMGGMYYHMSPQNSSQAQMISASQSMGSSTQAALMYVPDPNTGLGFKAGVGYKFSASEKAANGDVMLEVNFTSSGGLGMVSLTGSLYIMCNVSDRNQAPVIGNVSIVFDAVNQVFDATASVNINAFNSITGSGTAKVHFEPSIWYVCVGKPSNPVTLNLLNLVTAQSYFMIGNSIEQPATPPAEVLAIVGQYGLNNLRDGEVLANGAGFCGGARISSSMGGQFGGDKFNVYYSLAFGAGFDMMLMNYGPNAHCSGSTDKVGMNGWLAGGSLYIYLNGIVGAQGRVLGQDFDVVILQVGVAAIVGGKLPKPVYLYGALGVNYNILGIIKGNMNVDFHFGHDCVPVAG